ncbi:MAG: beta-N-acetylhexosaminidase, partial [Deltaproteobacteria bacterium]
MSRAGANVLLALLLLAGTASSADVDTVPGQTTGSVEELLHTLGLEQKVGQLLMVGFGGRHMEPAIAGLLRRLHVGSVALYSRNISSTRQVARLLADINRAMAGELPPFLAVDQEGGNVVRLKRDVMVLPGAMALGATGDEALAFLAGQAVATDLRLVGFNMNLAPVLDLNRDPRNPVINVRALGDDPATVSRLGVYL